MSGLDNSVSWVSANLSDIADWGSGGTPSRKNAAYYGGSVPWVKTGDLGPRVLVEASEYITEEGVANSSAKFFPKGSVAIAMYGATIGKTSILGIDTTTNQACAVGKPFSGATTSDFLYYFLRNEKDSFIAKGKGGAQPNISQALIKAHAIALPPLAEQKEIARQLDSLLAQVDSIKARLDAIPAIIKRFRQSVLAAAVSGKLTEEWRGDADYVDVNLELSKSTKLVTFPESWTVKQLSESCSVVSGNAFKSKEFQDSPDVPAIKISNVQYGKFEIKNQQYLPRTYLESVSAQLTREPSAIQH